jgi:hypothetical protein
VSEIEVREIAPMTARLATFALLSTKKCEVIALRIRKCTFLARKVRVRSRREFMKRILAHWS